MTWDANRGCTGSRRWPTMGTLKPAATSIPSCSNSSSQRRAAAAGVDDAQTPAVTSRASGQTTQRQMTPGWVSRAQIATYRTPRPWTSPEPNLRSCSSASSRAVDGRRRQSLRPPRHRFPTARLYGPASVDRMIEHRRGLHLGPITRTCRPRKAASPTSSTGNRPGRRTRTGELIAGGSRTVAPWRACGPGSSRSSASPLPGRVRPARAVAGRQPDALGGEQLWVAAKTRAGSKRGTFDPGFARRGYRDVAIAQQSSRTRMVAAVPVAGQ